MTVEVAELFAGYGGLGMGVAAALGDARVTWVSEIDPGPCKVLAHRYPGVPNLGDVSKIDWHTAPRVDVLTGGFPCQDVSHAGKRKGMRDGTRSGLWAEFRYGIEVMRPALVVIENVRGLLTAHGEPSDALDRAKTTIAAYDRLEAHLAARREWLTKQGRTEDARTAATRRVRVVGRRRATVDRARRIERRLVRAIARVLGELADLGYVGGWVGLRAADVGAPHGRFRIFIVAADAAQDPERLRRGQGWDAAPGQAPSGWASAVAGGSSGVGAFLPAPTTRDHKGRNQRGDDTCLTGALLPTPAVNDMGEGKTVEAWDEWTGRMKAAHGNGNGHGASLAIEAQRTQVIADSRASWAQRPDLGSATTVTDWGQYADAIHRWEQITRPAPPPTEVGPKGNPRLSAAFSEWLMGLPAGWITDVPGVTRNEALKLAGNGVVPQQAREAVEWLLPHVAATVDMARAAQ